MISNIFFLIGLLAAIPGSKSQIVIDPSSCQSRMDTMQPALNEMVTMSTIAYDRTQNVWNPNTPEDELRIVENTFLAYFGTHNNPEQNQNTARDVLYYLDSVRNLLTSGRNITIYCDESFLKKGAGLFRNKYYIKGTKPKALMDPGCGNNAGVAYSVPNQKLIVLCPSTFNVVQLGLGTPKNTDYATVVGTTYLARMRSVSSTLLHEALHHLFTNTMFYGNDEIYGDWSCRQLRLTNPTGGTHQPDCVMFYALALYLNLNDWSTGWARSYYTG